MPESGTRSSAAEVLIPLDRAAAVPLRKQLEQALRELIRSGGLQAGTLLPSSRTLAADLGVSRRLVVDAYEQLAAEGYLSSHERSATLVAGTADFLYVPNQNGTKFIVKFVERKGRGSAWGHLKVYAARYNPPSWPTENL